MCIAYAAGDKASGICVDFTTAGMAYSTWLVCDGSYARNVNIDTNRTLYTRVNTHKSPIHTHKFCGVCLNELLLRWVPVQIIHDHYSMFSRRRPPRSPAGRRASSYSCRCHVAGPFYARSPRRRRRCRYRHRPTPIYTTGVEWTYLCFDEPQFTRLLINTDDHVDDYHVHAHTNHAQSDCDVRTAHNQTRLQHARLMSCGVRHIRCLCPFESFARHHTAPHHQSQLSSN